MKRELDELLKHDARTKDGVEAAWNAEITRRLPEIDEGRAVLAPCADLRRRLIGH